MSLPSLFLSPADRESQAVAIELLSGLGPEVQGNVDESVLLENLACSPAERLVAASRAATQVEQLRRSVSAAKDA